jgi:hypothetical protein
MLILDPTITDSLALDPLASNWLLLIIESAGALGALNGDVSIGATVQGCVELGPMWTGMLVIAATFSGAVEIAP